MTQTPISPGIIDRITQAARYVINGVAPGGWFGPMQPLAPIAPPEVAGRRFDYPTGYNLTYTPRGQEPVTFADLRALADSCDILRSVIETRKDQVEAQEWTIRVAQSSTTARIGMPTDDQKRRIDLIMAFLDSPDKQSGFDQWLRQILEDMFIIDGVALYKRRNRAGGLYALEVIDAATIKILLDDSGRIPAAPDPAYQQVLKGVPAADYTREELMYLVHNPRSHKVYGYSHVEQVLVTVNIMIRRALHQLEYYREGSSPDALIGLPKEWSNDQIYVFQKNFDSMLSGNLGLRRRVRFLPGDFKYQETKAPPLKDAYDEFLARIICFVFSISPEPFVGQVNRATAETSHSRAMDEGLGPLMRYVRAFMNRIIATEFASPDLEFAWTESRAQDPQEAASIDVAYVGAGILTVDEVRAGMGLAPLPATASPSPVKKNIRKDDGDDAEDDDDESDDPDGDDAGDAGGDAGDDDFDAKHPRWPAGTPGDIGGQFAPKDEAAATQTLHDGIASDAEGSSGSGSAAGAAQMPGIQVADATQAVSDTSNSASNGIASAAPASLSAVSALVTDSDNTINSFIQWQLSSPSPSGGLIVQEINANVSGTQADGSPMNQIYHYWEVWPVDPGSDMTTLHAQNISYDDHIGGTVPAGSTGAITVDASARFYEGISLSDLNGFITQNPDTLAHSLPSSTTDPKLPTNNATPPVNRHYSARW